MKVFLKKLWELPKNDWLYVGFGKETDRDRFIGEASNGDQIVVLGAKDGAHLLEDRGYLLGIVEINGKTKDTSDPDWPHAVCLKKNVREFSERHLPEKVLDVEDTYRVTIQVPREPYYLLSDKNARAVLALPTK